MYMAGSRSIPFCNKRLLAPRLLCKLLPTNTGWSFETKNWEVLVSTRSLTPHNTCSINWLARLYLYFFIVPHEVFSLLSIYSPKQQCNCWTRGFPDCIRVKMGRIPSKTTMVCWSNMILISKLLVLWHGLRWAQVRTTAIHRIYTYIIRYRTYIYIS